jgi:hypothetical protein
MPSLTFDYHSTTAALTHAHDSDDILSLALLLECPGLRCLIRISRTGNVKPL